MTEEELRNLLSQPEGSALDFKQEWYQLEGKEETPKRQKQELVKDILSLANGNTNTAGQDAYLIIGAADKFDENGIRPLQDMGELTITNLQIQGWCSPWASPPLSNIRVQAITLNPEAVTLWVITVLATPYLYEAKQLLKTPKREFTEHTVLIRHDAEIKVASTDERAEIMKYKQVKFAERRNVDPVWYGTFVGIIIGGLTGMSFANYQQRRQLLPHHRLSPVWVNALGFLVGAVLNGWGGHSVGYFTREIIELRHTDWPFFTFRKRFFAIMLSLASIVTFVIAMVKMTRWLNKRQGVSGFEGLSSYHHLMHLSIIHQRNRGAGERYPIQPHLLGIP